MQRLPVASGHDVVKALKKAGFEIVGRRGSHVRLKKKTPSKTYIVIVPIHPEIKTGTLKSILRQVGLTREEFTELIRQKRR